MKKQATETKESAVSKPVSLAPLSFEEAVKGMLAIPPEKQEKKAQKKPAKKR
jgi:hypothetical protein